MSYCGIEDMARLVLVCRSLRILTKSSGAWPGVDLDGKTGSHVMAFVKLFPVALRAASRINVSLAANRREESRPYGFEDFRHLVVHACSELSPISGSHQEKRDARRDSRDMTPNLRVKHFRISGLDGQDAPRVTRLFPGLVTLRLEDAYIFTARDFQRLVSDLPHLSSLWIEGALAYDHHHPHVGALVLPARFQLFVCIISEHCIVELGERCLIVIESSDLCPSQLHTFRLQGSCYFTVCESMWSRSAKQFGEFAKSTHARKLRRLELDVAPSMIPEIMSLPALRHLTLHDLHFPDAIKCDTSMPHELEQLELKDIHGLGTHLPSFLHTILQSYNRLRDLRLVCRLDDTLAETVLNVVAASTVVC
jgi:hypothetical protein